MLENDEGKLNMKKMKVRNSCKNEMHIDLINSKLCIIENKFNS